MEATPDPKTTPSRIEAWSKVAELIGKYLAIFATIAGGFFGLVQYLDAKKKESAAAAEANATAARHEVEASRARLANESAALDRRNREFRLDFFRQQQFLYVEACKVAGSLATANDPKAEATKADIDRFYSLYWGDLCLVEDEEVEAAMVAYELALRDWKEGKAPQALRQLSYDLAHQCRRSLAESFEVTLDKLPGKPAGAVEKASGR